MSIRDILVNGECRKQLKESWSRNLAKRFLGLRDFHLPMMTEAANLKNGMGGHAWS